MDLGSVNKASANIAFIVNLSGFQLVDQLLANFLGDHRAAMLDGHFNIAASIITKPTPCPFPTQTCNPAP